MNNIQILGTITRDLEIRYTQGGTAIASFGIAYNEKRKQQDGSYGDVAHFFEVTAFGKKAEIVNQYFRKGSRILIDGSLDYQSWTDNNNQKRSKVTIKLNDFDFIDKNNNSENSNSSQNHNQQQPSYNHTDYQAPQTQQQSAPQSGTLPEIDIDDSEIPF